MKKPRPLLICLCITFVGLLSFTIWWSETHETAQEAVTALLGQGVNPNENSFIRELMLGRTTSIQHFMALGYDASTENNTGFTALAAAAQGGNPQALAIIMASLPTDSNQATNVITKVDAFGRNAIIAAAVSGKDNILSMLLDKLPPNRSTAINIINTQDKNGRPALYYAILKNNPASINLLLTRGADVSLINKDGETALMVAIKLHRDNIVPNLINADIALHQKAITLGMADKNGLTPLLYAIREQNQNIVKTLLNAQADVNAVNTRGTTPIMVVAETGNTSLADILISAGAKLNVADNFGDTPLTIAIQHNQTEFAKYLIDKGADPDFHTREISALQTVIDTEPFNADFFNYLLTRTKKLGALDPHFLFAAIDHKNAKIAKTLIDAGVSVTTPNEKGETLLYHALEAGDQDDALIIIDKGADVRQTGVAGITPLQLAVEHDETRVVEKLLSLGVGYTDKTSDGYTLAETAVYQGHPDVLKILLDKGAKVDLDFCVLWAIRDGGGKAVNLLLEHGANPNVMNENGDTALWLSSEAGETEAVQALIAHHALIDYPDKQQNIAPLAIASHNGHLDVVKLLAEGGAKIDAKDGYGFTALAHAVYMAKPDVVEYLVSKGADKHATDAQGRSLLDLAALIQDNQARSEMMTLLQKK